MGFLKFVRDGGVVACALVFSLGVHAGVFTCFSVIRISGEDDATQPVQNSVTVAQVRQVAQRQRLLPKPKIKQLELDCVSQNQKLEVEGLPRNTTDYKINVDHSFNSVTDSDIWSYSSAESSGTEFFGSKTSLRKICYVVDASGSMQGRLGVVRRQLIDSIESLDPDQFFYVIFFHGSKLIELGDGKMIRASRKSMAKANRFIDSVYFEGPTNAMEAIKRAMVIKDSSGNSPELIYFLSDGFDLDTSSTIDFAGLIENLRKRLAPKARINTIGFWVDEHDRDILGKISRFSGGEFVNVD